ncbi:protein of unknown function [Candidatus Promineifilum breve]|uniref:Uncharacterized protein n=1 Tax=Candidatus Promineifilum breve TaxID=1806508 RepID=A0A160T3S2_9CHLR|nr:protein of unknown function [Candidatus Promineifilum breve]
MCCCLGRRGNWGLAGYLLIMGVKTLSLTLSRGERGQEKTLSLALSRGERGQEKTLSLALSRGERGQEKNLSLTLSHRERGQLLPSHREGLGEGEATDE